MERTAAQNDIDSLRGIYSAVQRGDIAQLQECLSHDIEWVLPEAVPWGGVHHGHEGVQALREIFEDHVDGIWADPDQFLVADEGIVVLGRMSGRGRTSGRSFEVPFAHVWVLTDGVPSQLRSYFDTAPIAAALAP